MPRLSLNTVSKLTNITRTYIRPTKILDINKENDYYTIKALIHASCGALKYDEKSKTLKLK